MVSESVGVNSKGNMTFGGADCVELASRYGTPLYVYDESIIRKACAEFKESIDEFYDGNGQVLYASKAFSCKEMYRIIKSEGLGCDVVSAGELYTAIAAGFNADDIFFHGNNKTADELKYALTVGVGHIVVDNITELELLQDLACEQNKNVDILFRIKPGITAHTHDYVKTGQIDSKFGFALENGEALAAVKVAIGCKNLNLTGLHCHIGSQIFETAPFCDAAEVMLQFMADIRAEFGITLPILNLGGGFGVKYLENDLQVPFKAFIQKVSNTLKLKANALNYPIPKIFIEPGRAISGPAGVTLYTVGNVKEIKNIRTYVSIDGGMADNPRYALYNADYSVEVANRMNKEKVITATIAGKCCESGDLIQENVSLPKLKAGDTLAVLVTGAYNYSMSSNYNRIPRPAAVMVNNGESRVIIKRETYDDIIRNDI